MKKKGNSPVRRQAVIEVEGEVKALSDRRRHLVGIRVFDER